MQYCPAKMAQSHLGKLSELENTTQCCTARKHTTQCCTVTVNAVVVPQHRRRPWPQFPHGPIAVPDAAGSREQGTLRPKQRWALLSAYPPTASGQRASTRASVCVHRPLLACLCDNLVNNSTSFHPPTPSPPCTRDSRMLQLRCTRCPSPVPPPIFQA